MENRKNTATLVAPSPAKVLKVKLTVAVHDVLVENKAELTAKLKKVVAKALKKIVKKTNRKMKYALETS